MNTIDVKQSIADIIKTREPLVQRFDSMIGNVDELLGVLREIPVYATQEAHRLSNEQKLGIQQLPTTSLITHAAGIREELKNLKSRFGRGTLNIGVIGRARQGKSRLLQSLTGLSAKEIPDGDGMHCTGVRSSIFHQNGETYAEVYFYTESEFLQQVIQPYYDQLQLGVRPLSLDEFSSRQLEGNAATAVARAKLEHLKKYQEHLQRYCHLLNSSSPLRIAKEDISKFVTQYDPEDSSVAFYNYLAVKEVRIFCSFPNENVGKISVVDMPGLGDTGIGDEDRLVRTLGQEIDFILFVRMPKNTGDYWADVDVQLYDVANRALQDASLEAWSFQVLNRLNDSSNSRNCSDLQETIGVHHLRVAQVIIANCADTNDVQSKVLAPALQHIGTHIAALDQRFLQSCESHLSDLKIQLDAFLKQASQVVSSGGAKEYSVFQNLFKDFWDDKLTLGLELLRIDLWDKRQAKDQNLESALNKAHEDAKQHTGIPEIEEIKKQSMRKGSINKAYYDLLDVVRVTLSDNFQSQLDKSLQESVDSVKMRVAKIFIESGLDSLADKNGIEMLAHIFSLLEENLDRPTDAGMQKIHRGFNDLLEFRLLYRGLVQPRIRKHLDNLTAPREGIGGDRRAPDLGDNPSAELISEVLYTLHGEALYKIDQELRDLLWEPSMAAFAIIEEFLDCVLRAKNVESSWSNFLYDHREMIWCQEFRWQHLLSRVKQFAQPSTLSLMLV